jgi:outer membrane lipoprotein
MPQMTWTRYGLWGLIGLVALLSMGCARAISETMHTHAEPPIPFTQLRANPEAYKDRTVILGGEILQTNNLREGTRLEVLQKPLDRAQAPLTADSTGGRFIALCDGYLDPAIYAAGRRITIAGRVMGAYSGKVGEVDYVYPLISCEEKHLWAQVASTPRGYYGYPGWYWDPYVYPWYWRPYRYHFGGFYYPYW